LARDKSKEACCGSGCKCCGCRLGLIAVILLIIGGLNWGLVGLFNWNLVTAIFGSIPLLVQLIYVLVGLAALYKIYLLAMKWQN